MKYSRMTSVWCGGMLVAALSAPVHAGNVRGKVIFKGNPDQFKRMVINTQKDPNCAKSKAKIGTKDVILNKKTDPVTVRNVIVSIKSGPLADMYPTNKEPVTLTQMGCEYHPHVVAMQEGQPLMVLNGDDTNHNIHFLPKVNEEHNFTQPKKDLEHGREVDLEAEGPFKVKCDVHPWMGCYIAVFKHPFFAVTGRDGTYELKGVPSGTFTIEAWHETFGTLTAEVKVDDSGTTEHNFTYEK